MMGNHPLQQVEFHYMETQFRFTNRNNLKRFLINVFELEKKILTSLSYIFCSDTHLLEINKEFLQHDFFTDIITFDLSEKDSKIQGEIYISIDRVKDNSRLLHEPFKKELHRVILHGVLHLCGYKDKTEKDILIMRQKEEYYLDLYL